MALKCMVWDFDSDVTLTEFATNIKDCAVAAGWTLYDTLVQTVGTITNPPSLNAEVAWVVSKDFSQVDDPGEGYTDETLYVKIRALYYSSNWYILLTTYEDWNTTTHTGTNPCTQSTYSYGVSHTYQLAGTLCVSAGDKHLFVTMKDMAGTWATYSHIVGGFDRHSYDTLDLNAAGDADLQKSIRTYLWNTYNTSLYAARVGGLTQQAVWYYSAPTAGIGDHVNSVILRPMEGSINGKDPDVSAQTVIYALGYMSGLKSVLAEGADQLIITAPGTQFPNTTSPEWMVFKSGVAVEWCTPNFTVSE
ncbi:hypothetical protein [Desulfobacula sp.]|uniref:hypothetical protein n=1 Tax=Desulfobacula sp. TaxID=2593537 RepID=UPI00261BDEAB|nr:hypothetical protein [Desulfobacula sp.]